MFLPLVSGANTHVRINIREFGTEIQRPDLAEIVEHLYDAALQESSKKTYKTGQRAYFRFAAEIDRNDVFRPFLSRDLSRTELYLAFYIAFLVLKPSIKKRLNNPSLRGPR